MFFEYDEKKALRSEAPARITEPGAYVGTILQCELVKAKNSAAEFVRIWFQTTDDVTTWLNIFTKKKDGTEAFGVGYVMALMGLLGVQRMEAVPAKCRAWDNSMIDGERFLELEKKQIGFVLGMRDRKYTDANGFERIAYDPQIVRVFHPQTRKTITESRRNAEAKAVDQTVMAQIKAFEELKAKVEAERANAFESEPRAAQTTTADNLPSDIPF